MFSGHGGTEFPDRVALLRILLRGIDRLDSHGRLDLTYRTALALRRAGYVTALGRGPWTVPRLPLEMLRPHPSTASLAKLWYGSDALMPQLASPVAPPTWPTAEQGLRWALADILRNDDSRRLLLSIVRRGGEMSRRRLQQNHRRLPAACFNAALSLLTARRVITVSTDGLLQSVEGIGKSWYTDAVRHVARARAMRETQKDTVKTEPPPKHIPRPRVRRYRRRTIPDRYADPRGWALAMLGRCGGLARQRQARRRGEVSTKEATEARLSRIHPRLSGLAD